MDILNFNKDDEFSNIKKLTNKRKIEISLKQLGNKRITNISGWDIPNEELNDHLGKLKKKNACNGCLKDAEDKNGDIVTVLQLQGNHTKKVYDYLIECDIDKDSIYIKG